MVAMPCFCYGEPVEKRDDMNQSGGDLDEIDEMDDIDDIDDISETVDSVIPVPVNNTVGEAVDDETVDSSSVETLDGSAAETLDGSVPEVVNSLVDGSVPEVVNSLVDGSAAKVVAVVPSESAVKHQGRGTAILRRLAACREFLQANSFRVQWVLGGRMRVLITSSPKWLKSKKVVLQYRRALEQLLKVPLSSFLYHPKAYLEASDFLRWGRSNAIAVDSYGGENFDGVIPVLPDFQSAQKKKKPISVK
jgi:hypothetical protein